MKLPPKELDALFTPRSFTAGVKAQEAQSGYYLPSELLTEMIGGGSGRRRSPCRLSLDGQCSGSLVTHLSKNPH
jgi:hypothetical protein